MLTIYANYAPQISHYAPEICHYASKQNNFNRYTSLTTADRNDRLPLAERERLSSPRSMLRYVILLNIHDGDRL